MDDGIRASDESDRDVRTYCGRMSRSVTLPRPSPWLFDVTLTMILMTCGIVALYVYSDDSGVVYRDGDGLSVLLVGGLVQPGAL